MDLKRSNDLKKAIEELRCSITNVEDNVGWKNHYNKAMKIIDKYNVNDEMLGDLTTYKLSVMISRNSKSKYTREGLIEILNGLRNELIYYCENSFNLKI